jgi:predicted phosphoribosyltransferase
MERQTHFRDRAEAGRHIAELLGDQVDREQVIVLGLPRGGVPVAYEVAKRLGAPLDVFVVRKLGVPGHEELAMGAVASGGLLLLDERIVHSLGIDREAIKRILSAELQELQRREAAYREGREPLDLKGHTVILVDDGLATGSTMRVAALAVRRHQPARLIIAVPVAPPETCESLRDVADEVVCAVTPKPFRAVGEWYGDFRPTSDEEVRELLARAAEQQRAAH